jgi:hypothetical protein
METKKEAICGCNTFGKITKNGKVIYWICRHGFMYDFTPLRIKLPIPPAPKREAGILGD